MICSGHFRNLPVNMRPLQPKLRYFILFPKLYKMPLSISIDLRASLSVTYSKNKWKTYLLCIYIIFSLHSSAISSAFKDIQKSSNKQSNRNIQIPIHLTIIRNYKYSYDIMISRLDPKINF